MRAVFLVLLAISLVPAYAGAAQNGAEKSTAKRISDHIQQSGQLKSYRIGVTYQKGIALLSGTVTSPEQRDAAVRLAKEVNGVKRVECKLQIADKMAVAPLPPEAEEQPEGFNEAPIAKQAGQQGISRSATPAATQADPQTGVVQAYTEPGIPAAQPLQRPTMQSRMQPMQRRQPVRRSNMPLPQARMMMGDPNIQQASAQGYCPPGAGGGEGYAGMGGGMGGPGMGPGMGPMPTGVVPTSYGAGPNYENAQMPGYAWPSYAAYPNYAAVSYPQQYSPTAWPYIGPFYPYPQVPLGWRKVTLEWDDGWWFLDFDDRGCQ